jgi:Casein kinase II regulatory subunit
MLLLNRCLRVCLSLVVLFSTRQYFSFLPAVCAGTGLAHAPYTPATTGLNPSSDLDSTESYDDEHVPLGDLLTEKVPHDFFREWRQILRRSWSILMHGDVDFQSRVRQLLAPRPMTLPLALPSPSSHPPPTSRLSRYESSTTSPALEPPESNIMSSLLATTTPWVRRFLADRRCDVLLPVPADYIQDPFNLVHLGPVVEMVHDRLHKRHEAFSSASHRPKMSDRCNQTTHNDTPNFRRALARILAQQDNTLGIDDSEDSSSCDGDEPDDPRTVSGVPSIQSMIEEETATILYLLIHQRFVLSPRGMELIRRMLVRPAGSTTDLHPIFGQCPRRSCQGTTWLPHGLRNDPTIACKFAQASTNSRALAAPVLPVDYRCHRYCPSCRESFYCWDSVTDGCAWGTSFAMLFLLTFGDELFPTWRQQQTMPPSNQMTRSANPLPRKEWMDHNECQIDEALPRVFGFPLLVGSSCKKC